MCSTMCGTPVQAISDQKNSISLAGGSGKFKICPWNDQNLASESLRTQANAMRVGWRDHLGTMPQGPLTHFEAAGGLQYYFWGRFWPSVVPAANLVKIFVPHIIPYISWRTCTFWGHFRPSPLKCFSAPRHQILAKSAPQNARNHDKAEFATKVLDEVNLT